MAILPHSIKSGLRIEPTRASLKEDFPWWLILLGGMGLFVLLTFLIPADNRPILTAIASGIWVTLYAAAIAYLASLALGLCIGLMRSSRFLIVRQIAILYIELVRGLPMLLILYVIAFVATPFLVTVINFILSPFITIGLIQALEIRDLSFAARAIIALTFGYSAYIAEIFRAGIQSVDKGQTEAAAALGLSRGQIYRRVILPQAIRNIMPALANEMVAIIKDSSLVSVLGVQDITQLGKVYSAATFRFFDTYLVVAFYYLILTVSLSFLARRLERRLHQRYRRHALEVLL